ncbi:MAG TPA: T9SS type A sorting domain-containing protein, partial [Chitinophagaceae bacterium]
VSADDLVVLQDGKILVAGTANKSGAYARAFIACYLPDGSIDNSFGTNGLAYKGFSFATFKASIGLQTDGSIVGAVNVETYNASVFRFTAGGVEDAEFGTDPTNNYEDNNIIINDLAIQSDNKILITGGLRHSGANPKIARLYENGSLEGSLTLSDIQGFFTALAIQPDGKIVTVGVNAVLGFDFLTVRLDNSGLPDDDFGQDGIVTTPVGASGDDTAKAVSILPTGEILVAGTTLGSLLNREISAVLYNTDGSLNDCFGTGGIVPKVDLPGGSFEYCTAMDIQEDGKIVFAGSQHDGVGFNFVLARYVNDNVRASIDADFGSPLDGMAPNTIYLGYGSQQVDLQAIASGGDGNYIYSWSTGSSAANITVSPSSTTTYHLTVTDGAGCEAISSITINVVDLRCGKKNDKILVCHTSKGKPTSTCVSINQLQAHLNHGDLLGPCNLAPTRLFGQQESPGKNEVTYEDSPGEVQVQQKGVIIYPNPTASSFTIQLNHSSNQNSINLRVYDITGRLVEEKQNIPPGSILTIGSGYRPGIYQVRMQQGDVVHNARIVKIGN